MYQIQDLIKQSSGNFTKINNKWVAARPINHKHRSFSERLKDSWAVFIGKADAVKWPENQ